MNQKVENELGGFIDPHASYYTSGSDLAPGRELVKRGPDRRQRAIEFQDVGTVRVLREVKQGEVLQIRMRVTDRRRVVSQAERDMLVTAPVVESGLDAADPHHCNVHASTHTENAREVLRVRIDVEGEAVISKRADFDEWHPLTRADFLQDLKVWVDAEYYKAVDGICKKPEEA